MEWLILADSRYSLSMRAQLERVKAQQEKLVKFNPRPAGQIVEGSTTAAILELLRQSPGFLAHSQIVWKVRRGRGAVAWGLRYLQHHKLIRAVKDYRRSSLYLRYAVIKEITQDFSALAHGRKMKLRIDPEFKSLIPPLKAEEFAQLEANILADGCRDPLVLWGDTLIDGHNRYEICQRRGVEFDTVQMEFASREDTKIWILQNQFGRRNLTDFQRTELALLLKPLVEGRAKANLSAAGAKSSPGKPSENSHEVITAIRTDETIADMAGVSSNTVRKVENILTHAAPGIAEAARSGEISIHLASQVAELPEAAQAAIVAAPEVREAAREAVHNHRAQGTGENEWYTPDMHIEVAREFFGEIDLDPASSEIAQKTVQAKQYFTLEDDGLKQDWHGRVWLNPPYAQPAIQNFITKTVDEFTTGGVDEAIVLTHNYTDTGWFHAAAKAAAAICFTRGRIGFVSPEGKKASPTQGQAFFYFGDRLEEFADAFCRFGFVMVRR